MDKKTQKYILNILRLGTVTWSGRTECLRLASVRIDEGKVTKSGKSLSKLYWRCAHCKELFRDQSMMEVDHIVEVGPFNGDFDVFIKRLYCDQSNLQALCLVCHSKKTSGFNAELLYSRKKI